MTVFTLDKNPETIQKLREELPSVHAEVVNLADWEQTRKVVESFGTIDHLVNNAAVLQLQDFMDITKESINLHFDVNVGAVINVTQVVAKGLVDLGREGSIVNICSIGAKFGSSTGAVIYAASKAALENLTKSMALTLGAEKIRVNCVLPGVVDTPMFHSVMDSDSKAAAVVQKAMDRQAIKRPVTPDEVGTLVMFLLSPLSSMIVGESIIIDGGRMAS